MSILDALLITAAIVVVAALGYAYKGHKAPSGPPAPHPIVAARADRAVPSSPSVQRPGAPPRPDASPDQNSSALSTPQAEEHAPELQLVQLRCRREDQAHVIEGVVRNATKEPLSSVFVVGVWGTADGQVVKTDDAPVKDDPIPPQQVTSFRVSTFDSPDVAICRVAFRTFMGDPIPWADARSR